MNMTINLNGIELELPDGSKIEISNDGKTAKVVVPEAEVIERIVVVEVEGPETIRYIPVNNEPYKPYGPQVQPVSPWNPWNPNTTPWVTGPQYPWGTTSGGTVTLDGTGGATTITTTSPWNVGSTVYMDGTQENILNTFLGGLQSTNSMTGSVN
jgi:hypothetical protein